MKSLRNIWTIVTLFVALTSVAVPARRNPRVVTQPDGSTVTLRLVGDESRHYYITDDDQIVVSRDKAYYFATLDKDGRAKASDFLASDASKRTAAQAAFLSTLDPVKVSEGFQPKRVSKVRAKAPSRAAIEQSGIGLFPGTAFPAVGSPHGLIILVEYTDVKFRLADPHTYFTNLLTERGFSENGATGSALDYFIDASMGKFTPQFDVYGPVCLANNMAYYGANDINTDDDVRPEQMIIEGCKLLDGQIDFTKYDEDNDGYVDNVFVFYAGYGEASSDVEDSVWPHQYSIEESGFKLTLDGKKINNYACTNEWTDDSPAGIGTFCHEFSHVLGLPDLYKTYGTAGFYTPDAYSVLDYGPYNNNGRTPPTYSSFERNALGWIDLTVINPEPRSKKLKNLLESNKACIIPTPKKNEFFLLENRQQKGWDKYLPGHGMLIWHIDYNASIWNSNSVNNSGTHQYVDIEEASGSYYNAPSSFTFPGTRKVTSFTDDTTPSMKTWSKQNLNTPITNIAEHEGIITFDVCGGGVSIAAPVVTKPTDVGTDYFTATWLPVDDAADYLLTVKVYGEGVPENEYIDFGSGNSLTIPSGWKSNTTNTFTGDGYYGESAPSLKMSTNGSYIMSPVYSAPIARLSMWLNISGEPNTTNSVDIIAVNNSKETKLYNLPASTLTGTTMEFDLPDDVYQIKIKYNKPKSGLNVALDDIKVEFEDPAIIVPGYDEVSTSGTTSMRVDNLIAGENKYMYKVAAVDAAGDPSPDSEYQVVDLENSSVDEILTNEIQVYVVGRDIIAQGGEMTVVDVCGRTLGRSVTRLTVPTAGIYIVNLPTRTIKLAVK